MEQSSAVVAIVSAPVAVSNAPRSPFKDADSVRGLAIGLTLSALLWAPLFILVPRLI